jgi:hypothetical protein
MKVEYLSNQWSDPDQIWNLSYNYPTRVYKGMKYRQPSMEDNLQQKMTSKH